MVKKTITYSRSVLKTPQGKSASWKGSKVIQFKPQFKGNVSRKRLIEEVEHLYDNLLQKGLEGSLLIIIQDPNTGKWASGDFTSMKKKEKPSIPSIQIDSSGRVEDVEDMYEDPNKYQDFRIYLTEKDITGHHHDDFVEVDDDKQDDKDESKKDKPLRGGSLCEKAFFTKGIADDEASIITFEYMKYIDGKKTRISKKNVNYIKDGNLYENQPYDDLYKIRSKPKSSGYLVVQRIKEPADKRSLMDYHNDFLQMADDLKEATCGNINLYKTGSIKKTALNLFYNLNQENKKIEPEPISAKEAHWIESATCGALTHYIDYEGECYGYDVHSFYPSIVSYRSFRIPIKCGTFKKHTFEGPLKSDITYGIYRCTIEGDINPFLFRINKKNFYTSYDIAKAIRLGYTVKYIIDDKDNALVYQKGTYVEGPELFKEFMDFLYQFKKDGVKGIKLLMNMLIGALYESNIFKLTSEHGDIGANRDILKVYPIIDENGNEITVCTVVKTDSRYETSYARIKPFVYSKGRDLVARLYNHQIEDVVRVHTDGFILKAPLTQIKNRKLDDEGLGKLGVDNKYTGKFRISKNKRPEKI